MLRPAQTDVTFSAKDIGIKVCDPLATAASDVEMTDGDLHVLGDAVPVELRVFVDEIGGVVVAELAIAASLLELVVEGVGLADVMGIAELADEVGGPHQT